MLEIVEAFGAAFLSELAAAELVTGLLFALGLAAASSLERPAAMAAQK